VIQPAEVTPEAAAECSGRTLRYAPHLGRALRVALLVGTCLTILNQGDVIAGAITDGATPHLALLWKVPLTYVVPFLVSMYSSVAAAKS
jgi:hypothetical protein